MDSVEDIARLVELCVRVTRETKHRASCDYCSTTDTAYVYVYFGGFDSRIVNYRSDGNYGTEPIETTIGKLKDLL